jgi:hypothetical protein
MRRPRRHETHHDVPASDFPRHLSRCSHAARRHAGSHGILRFGLVNLIAASLVTIVAWLSSGTTAQAEDMAVAPVDYRLELDVVREGFDGKTCWVHARCGVVPADGQRPQLAVMTMQKLLLSGSDVFYALNEVRTEDQGRTWTEPFRHETLARRDEPDGVVVAICDFTPKWHAASGKLLGTGQTVRYSDNRVMKVRHREPAYSVYDPNTHRWSAWDVMPLPDEARFKNAGSGSTQRVDLPGGDILLPIYFKPMKETQFSTTVVRCRFDGEKLRYVEHGSELTVPIKRGLYEPSLTRFGERFFLTLRNDDHGYVTSGTDGLHFAEPRRWTFDDGKPLGNYNTQQHWVTHADGLFLVYTRRGAMNDHVFRHRAPLFMAQVDPEKLHVIRSTERVLVPENGARQGNFGVVDVSPQETWVTVTEWMQPQGVKKYGSNNRLYVARILWERPNTLVDP